MRFRNGDIVKISKKSEWYGKGRFNPADVEGKITRIDADLDDKYPIRVRWNTQISSFFSEDILRLVRRKDEI